MDIVFRDFHIVRAVIVRCLWIHRNDIRFNNAASYFFGIQAWIDAVVNIRTEYFSQDLSSRSLRHSSITLRQLLTLLSALHLRQFEPTGSLPEAGLLGRPGDAVF